MSSAPVYYELNQRVRASSQKHIAKQLNVSPQYINDLLAGRREFSARICKALGFERVITYRKTREGG